MSQSRSSQLRRGYGHRHHWRHEMALIELSTKVRAIRRSKIAFWTIGSAVALCTAVIGSAITSPARAVLIGLVAGLSVGFVAGFSLFCWPAIRVFWHWAPELILFTGLLVGYLMLTSHLPWWGALATLGAPGGALVLVPALRRRVWPWVMCAISRHRLRVCFHAFISTQRSGMAPLILCARPIPAGERVWIWLRPGLALADLEQRLDRIATGCWAAECRITPASRRHAAFVHLDLVRRNPLSAAIRSPLPTRVPTVNTPSTVPVAAASGLDLPDIQPPPSVAAHRPSKALTAQPVTPDPVISDLIPTPATPVDDLSDWI